MTRHESLGALLSLLLAACGGTTEQASGTDSGTEAHATDSGLSQDSGPDAAPACPADAPAQGAECPAVGFECQYSTNFFDSCAQIADCTATGWSLTGPPNTCLSGSCPASYSALADAGSLQACSQSLQVTDCWYPQGVCQCSGGLGGPAQPLGWYCLPTAPGCPYPTPPVGSPCTTSGQVCGFSCSTAGVVCKDGTWQANTSTCPV
jgi:hypothetical protein